MTKEKLMQSLVAAVFRCSLILIMIMVFRPLYAQNKLHITKVRATEAAIIAMPLMVDSTNLKNEKFENKKLLETNFLPQKQDFAEELTADTANFISFGATADDNRLRCLSFNVNTDRYAKLKITVSTADMAELYVNGKKEASKTTVEDSLNRSKNLEKEISVPTGTVEFTLKCLRLAEAKAAGKVKILIEAKDTTVNLALGGNKRHIRINDIMEGARVGGANISPNGRFILLSYSNTVEGGEVSRYNELYDTKIGKSRYLDKSLSWTPASNKLYYTAQRGDNNSLIFVEPETMAETVFAENIPKGNFRLSPDEKYLIYSVKESNDERKGDLLILKSPADRQEGYLDRYFIYLYNIADKVNRQLTFGNHTTSVHDFSRDSRYLLFATTDEHITERPFRKSSMFILDIQTLKVDTLWKDEKYAHSASFSPDGTKILVSGAPEAFDGVGLNIPEGMIANSYDNQAFIIDRATGKIDAISKNFNPCISRMSWHTNDDIYMSVEDADYQKIYRYNLSKKTYTCLNLPEEVVGTFNTAINGNTAAYIGTSSSNFGRAYLYDIKTGASTLVSDPMKDRLAGISLGNVRDWDFKASDGTTIKGRYYLPPNFDAARKYPLIVYYYGGTAPTQRVIVHSYPLHVYAAMGYVVYTLQPSGTTGFGQEFAARHVNAWGRQTADEIIEGTKRFAAEHAFVDERKIGCIGASYGGFMTMYLQTVTDIFAAAVSHAGISALASYWGEGYWGYAYSGAASAGSYPWNNRELYIEQSPLYNADKIKTPLLLLHGMEDTNVPPGESIQMYTALKILGKPVEFIRVKGENHGIATYKRRLEWNYSIYAWFAKWLKDDPSWWNSMYK
ncbi:MAG: S9 family peptidase [Prevotellaceae bacterium]|nr:S9 family peptidase [Prevotellaceae bacterium]